MKTFLNKADTVELVAIDYDLTLLNGRYTEGCVLKRSCQKNFVRWLDNVVITYGSMQ